MGAQAESPYARQTRENIARLEAPMAAEAAGAAEALGFLRAEAAGEPLARALKHAAPEVRREATLALSWCGGRAQLPALLAALDDMDWTVRQSAWVALTNLTGQDWPFDALAAPTERGAQAKTWRDWWAAVPADAVPREVWELLGEPRQAGPRNFALGCATTFSANYKGTGGDLTDGARGGGFWQTKNVPFPQHCTIDLGAPRKIGCVVVHQYGPGFCMTDYALSTSSDGQTWREAIRHRATTPPRLAITFEPHEARYVRITSFATQNRIYPTTFYEVEAYLEPPPEAEGESPELERLERGLRALAVFARDAKAQEVRRAYAAVSSIVESTPRRSNGTFAEKALLQTGLRSLGRLGKAVASLDPGPLGRPITEDVASFDGRSGDIELLLSFLRDPHWARYAAEALADTGGRDAARALIEAYPAASRTLEHKPPKFVPTDDRPGFEAEDRMYETPYAIAAALGRMPLSLPWLRGELRQIAPYLVANIVSDYDGAMFYEAEAHEELTAYLLECAGLRRAICDLAFQALGLEREIPPDIPERAALEKLARRAPGDVPYAACWLSALCREAKDVPALIALLEHENGWARINAAKTLMYIGDRRAVAPLAALLEASPPEAAHGYFGGVANYKGPQGQDEYESPAPRWREAYIHALGQLSASECAPLLVRILDSEDESLQLRHAAATALDKIGGDAALAALRRAEAGHPFHSVRLVAREALWRRGALKQRVPPLAAFGQNAKKAPLRAEEAYLTAVVFIKGARLMPNSFQIDPWRQTYSTTDTGPTYRLGRNLYRLRLAGGKAAGVTPLTHFPDGYVADCEVSWDGERVVFAHRGENDPWWHIYEINVDGTGLRQLTSGPYHDVQPAFLPDGRIVFASSRIGMRDEYHGYHATGLTVMDADGGGIRCLGFNLGRDNEPSVAPDGRILFSRLELFYSRLKTEITLHAVLPDGTRDVTLYGPEKRAFWAQVTRESGERWWGESGPRHRVLRLTQPQAFDADRVLCASTGGLVLIGPGKQRETFVPHDKSWAVTSPFPLGDGRILCAATRKEFKPNGTANATNNDLGLYIMKADTGEMTPLYNDPEWADFEPRPVRARPRPPLLAENPAAWGNDYVARLFCHSAFNTRDPLVRERGKLVRVIEGLPIVGRHHTHRSKAGPSWKNHTGTLARVLGTAPLAADGSFLLEAPADRLLHLQVLDGDRRVVGNQLIWMYARPGETRSCVGCHEPTDTTRPTPQPFALAAKQAPVKCLPTGGEFKYRAKAWRKGVLADEGEERTRTVRAVNLMARQ